MPLLLLMVMRHEESLHRLCTYFGISTPRNGTVDTRAAVLSRRLRPVLETISERDIVAVGEDASFLPGVLLDVPSLAERKRIAARWSSGIARTPAFAEVLLRGLGPRLGEFPELRTQVRKTLQPLSLATSRGVTTAIALRDLLAAEYREEVLSDEAFSFARQGDEAYRLRQKATADHEAALAQAHQLRLRQVADAEAWARQERIRELDALPTNERLRLIVSQKTGLALPLPERWADISDDDLERIPREVRGLLQRQLRSRRRGPWKRLRQRIYLLNRQAKESEREQLRRELANSSTEQRIRHLTESDTPVGYYPAELVGEIMGVFPDIPQELTIALVKRLKYERRGAWRRLSVAISAALHVRRMGEPI